LISQARRVLYLEDARGETRSEREDETREHRRQAASWGKGRQDRYRSKQKIHALRGLKVTRVAQG